MFELTHLPFQVNISLLVKRILLVSVDIQFKNFVNNVSKYSFKSAISLFL